MTIVVKNMKEINLLLDNKLHDASIVSLKYNDNDLYIKVDCEGMNLEELCPGLDSIYFTIECKNIRKLNFDFDGIILIDTLTIDQDDKVEIKISNGDLYLECDSYNITDIDKREKTSRENLMLDKILKSNV